MQVTLKVKRYDPELPENQRDYYQEYDLDISENSTVLDCLIDIREYQDETLSLRCSCRGAICGSCAMRVNGNAALGCKTKITSVLDSNNSITVGPMGNHEVVKDLVVDIGDFWNKLRAVKPWISPIGDEPEAEYIAPNEDMQHLVGVVGCILCGACVSDCTVLEVDNNFLGPAALAKAYRFVADPRDGEDVSRLESYNEYGGIWDCTRCMACVEVCPKGVAPMDRIMSLREKAIEAGFTNTAGARHSEAFESLVAHSGSLDETQLLIKTIGIFNFPKLISLIPFAIRAGFNRKVPPLMHKSIPGVENIRRIHKLIKSSKK